MHEPTNEKFNPKATQVEQNRQSHQEKVTHLRQIFKEMRIRIFDSEDQIAIDQKQAKEWARKVERILEKYTFQLGISPDKHPPIDLHDTKLLRKITIDPGDEQIIILACQQLYNRFDIYTDIADDENDERHAYFELNTSQLDREPQIDEMMTDPYYACARALYVLNVIREAQKVQKPTLMDRATGLVHRFVHDESPSEE
jgi:hypothetical protein